jgi:hypothetical protein
MRRILLPCLALLAALFAVSQSPDIGRPSVGFERALAQICTTGAGKACGPQVVSGGGGGGGCTEATTFLARTSGLSGTETTGVTTAICRMVTDGDYSNLDLLYIFGLNNTTTAALNVISTSFGITVNGSCTFAADHGYTGDASTCNLDTSYTPSTASLNYARNCASQGVYNLTSRTTHNDYAEIGATDIAGTSTSVFVPLDASGNTFLNLNDFGGSVTGPANAQGSWSQIRTSSTAITTRKNETTFNTRSQTSTLLPAGKLRSSSGNQMWA